MPTRPFQAALTATLMATALLAAQAARAQSPGGVWPTDEFCGRAQSFVTLGNRRPTNMVQESYDKFRDTPVSVQPLQTQQFTVADEGAGRARLISCKLAAAEALRAAYGPDAARSDSSCALVNRNTFNAVLAALTPAERARARYDGGKKVAFDRDVMAASAADWLEPGEAATVDKRGTLRLVSRAFLGEDAGQKVHHCHLVAPDFARRLLLDGALVLPGTPVRR